MTTTEQQMDQCPTCGRDAYTFVQAVPGDPDAEHVCTDCAAYWQRTHVWDDNEGTYVEKGDK